VYLNADGVLAGLKPGAVAVDMTTTSPSLAVEIFAAARKNGQHTLDAPVSGGDVGAKKAALSIMVGGEEAVFDRVRPLFECLGRIILHQGPAGGGQHTKMCNQIVIAGSMIGVCESLLYATRAGLDPKALLGSISKGAAGCWSLENLAPRILRDDYAPGFMIDHFIKDMGIALEESRRMGLKLPGLELVHGLYSQASADGHGRDGTQALFMALQKLSA
ncbi:MAG: NAD(P)-dependent oxidoreductase, partial [Humidesulfovibrio sp.]|nr:NAD(P)-dependent oxidoreductase [Humidesulfovibrio sp.]